MSTMAGCGVVGLGSAAGRGRPLNLKMKFVCGQCWREGQVNEPDKNLKYCTAKARHRLVPPLFGEPITYFLPRCPSIFGSSLLSWTKERRVLLVKSFEKKKWVVVRPLPFSRTYPQQYDVSAWIFFFPLTSLLCTCQTFRLPCLLSTADSVVALKEVLFQTSHARV